jgi:hypothetical protein
MASYARTQAALAAVSGGTGYAKIGLLGDSTMAGAKAGTSGAAKRATSPVTFLRDRLAATQNRPVIASNWIGDQRFQVTNSIDPYTFDGRFSQPDGVGFIATSGATPVSIGGGLMTNVTNGNRFGFLPEVATDTTDVHYAVNTTLGAFSISRNGGSAMAVNQSGASGMGKVTYSSPLNSSDPIYLSRTSGGVYVVGMDSYNSAIKSIRLFGMGWSGGRAADWAGTLTGFDPLNGLLALNLDLVVARFGTNDISNPGATTTSTNATTYQASINKILDALLAAGTDVILATHYPMNPGVMSQAVQDTYAGYVRSIAAARDLKLHDTYARVGTWAAASADGKVYDNLHPNAAGYQDDAAALATLVMEIDPAVDTTAPVMTGSITVSGITSSGFTLACGVATDAVGVAGYEYSIDGGTSYSVIANAARSVVVSGRPASTVHQVRMRAFDAAGNRATPLSASLTTLVAQPAQNAVSASTVAESRRVAFPGGTRVVKFGSVPSARLLNAPYLETGRWWSEKHPLDERYWVADITIDLAERGTTAKEVVALVAGVTVIEEPVIQGKLIAVKLGGFNAAIGASNFCTLRITLANGERIDRTTWFKQQVGVYLLDKDPDEQSYFVGNDLVDSNTTATQVKALPVGVEELVPAVIQGSLILVKLGGMDTLPAGANYCDFRIDCANSERFYRTIQFNRVDN